MKAEEFSKVSIHNHLGGRGADRTLDDDYTKACFFDMDAAKNKIDEAALFSFDLIALTQANRLPAKQYEEIRKYAKEKNVVVLPGVEINLKNESEDKYLHTVVVFDDKKDVSSIEKTIDSYINTNQSNHLEMAQFLDLITKNRCIIAAHGLKQRKENRSAINNPDTFSELISIADSIPVVMEDNQKYHKTTLINELKDQLTKRELKWLDKAANLSAADRSSFKDIKSPTYIWGNPNFDDLYYSCFMSGTRIKRESDIITKVNYISKIEIEGNDETQLRPCTITCSHGLNSIIGASGSGKTLLLDIIKRGLTGQGVENKTISTQSNYEEIYDIHNIAFYNKDGKKLNNDSGYKVVEGEILYNKVITAYQSDRKKLLDELNLKVDLTKMNALIDIFNDKLNKYIRDRIKLLNNRKEIDQLIQNINSATKFLEANTNSSKENIEFLMNYKIIDRIKEMNRSISTFTDDANNLNIYFDEIRLCHTNKLLRHVW